MKQRATEDMGDTVIAHALQSLGTSAWGHEGRLRSSPSATALPPDSYRGAALQRPIDAGCAGTHASRQPLVAATRLERETVRECDARGDLVGEDALLHPPGRSDATPFEQDEEDEGAIERTSKPKSIWIGGEFSSDSGKRALKELLPGTTFDFPKSVELIRTCVLLGSSGDDIVLDFFAGSATSGQAVMAQNAIDGQNRRYIMVQLPEPLDPNEKEQKAAAAYCDSEPVKNYKNIRTTWSTVRALVR